MTLNQVAELLGAARFMPHSICLGREPWIIGLFVASHGLVGIAYVLISGVLFFDRAAATRAMFDNRVAFGAFIVLCGLSHIVAAITFYAAVYWLEAAILLATCIVSVTVAVVTVQTLRVRRTATT